MSEAAVRFLRKFGGKSLVSLGCGHQLNNLDNHLKLFNLCGLDYYVAIDLVPEIRAEPSSAFANPSYTSLYCSPNNSFKNTELSNVNHFFNRMKLFPQTRVEELKDIHCNTVICQRVLPFRHWEKIITSMAPILVLQEDLRGCELQQLHRDSYRKSLAGILHFQLQPFRPIRFFPWEYNLVLWRRDDFQPFPLESLALWKRVFLRMLPTKSCLQLIKQRFFPDSCKM